MKKYGKGKLQKSETRIEEKEEKEMEQKKKKR